MLCSVKRNQGSLKTKNPSFKNCIAVDMSILLKYQLSCFKKWGFLKH